MSSAATAFRDRKVLFAVLGVVLAANAAVLLSYRTFYDERLRALRGEQARLESRRDAARHRAEEAVAAERKLFETQKTVTAFFDETLGERKTRIASLIEEIYAKTREAGLRPDAIAYRSVERPGVDALTMGFSAEGPYRDVKRLLADLESSKRFLVVDGIALSGASRDEPDVVRIRFTVTNYFRPGSLPVIRTVREPASGGRAVAPRREEVVE